MKSTVYELKKDFLGKSFIFAGLRYRVLFFFAFIFLSASICAQDPAYHRFTVEEGLPSNQIFYLHASTKGKIWVGTDQGLASFNGRRFKTYPSPSTSSKAISPVLEDKNGIIWCANFNGQIFYLEGDSLKELHHGLNTTGLIMKLAIDKKTNRLFANTQKGLLVYDIDKKKVLELKSPDGVNIVNLAIDDEGNGVVITSNNIFRFKKNTFTLLHLPREKFLSKGLVIQKLHPFFWNHNAVIYNTVDQVLYQINSDTVKKISDGFFGYKNEGANNFAYEKNSILYANFSQGAYTYSAKTGGKEVFKGYNISNSVFDEEGGLWLSTLNKGLLYVPETHTVVSDFGYYEPNPEVYCLYPYNNKIYIGQTKGRVSYYDDESKKISTLLDLKEPDQVNVITSDSVKKQLYIGSFRLFRYSFSNKLLDAQDGISIKDLSFHKGTLFVSTPGGALACFDKEPAIELPTKMEKIYYPKNNLFSQFTSIDTKRSISHKYLASRNELWSCGSANLYYTKQKKINIVNDSQGKAILGSWLAEYNGDIICATAYAGVHFIHDNKIVFTLSKSNGLLSNSIKKVRVYGDELLIICNRGVSIYHLITKKLNHYTQGEGVFSKEIYDACIFNEFLFIGTVNGLYKTDISNDYFNKVAPRISIRSIFINGKRATQNMAQLSNSENNLSFFMDAIAFKANGQLKIEYKLLRGGAGYWQTISNEQDELRFNSLSPGNYELLIRAFNEDGVQSEILKASTFTILAPVWTRWWFIAICMILLGFLFYVFYKYRLGIQKNENRLQLEKTNMEKELQNSQLSSLKVQMNPHFLFNALNSIQEFILTNEKKLANQYLGKFSDLMRMTLDMSQEEKVLLADEIKVLKLYLELEELRFGEDFIRRIIVEKDINTDDIYIPAMLIQPYVENALKHGLLHRKGPKLLEVTFKLKPNENVLICIVDDNGIGRIKSEELKNFRLKNHKSFATGATKKRLELLNMDRKNSISVVYSDKPGVGGESGGTLVQLEIPFG